MLNVLAMCCGVSIAKLHVAWVLGENGYLSSELGSRSVFLPLIEANHGSLNERHHPFR
jgi:hypothetical protein